MPKVTKSHWDLVNVNQHWGEKKKRKKEKIAGGRGEKVERKRRNKKHVCLKKIDKNL